MDAVKRALGGKALDDPAAPATIVEAFPADYPAQIQAVCSVCKSIETHPASCARAVADRWRALDRAYALNPVRGAAYALTPSLQVGADRFAADFKASARVVRGGSVPSEPRSDSAATKRSRRKRANARSRRSSSARLARYESYLSAALERVASTPHPHRAAPVTVRSLSWSYLFGTWETNELGGGSLAPGSCLSIESRAAECVLSVLDALVEGRTIPGSAVSPRKPHRGRGAAPKATARFDIDGAPYELERAFVRRTRDGTGDTWQSGACALTAPSPELSVAGAKRVRAALASAGVPETIMLLRDPPCEESIVERVAEYVRAYTDRVLVGADTEADADLRYDAAFEAASRPILARVNDYLSVLCPSATLVARDRAIRADTTEGSRESVVGGRVRFVGVYRGARRRSRARVRLQPVVRASDKRGRRPLDVRVLGDGGIEHGVPSGVRGGRITRGVYPGPGLGRGRGNRVPQRQGRAP
jgi:hypothetical protein